MSFQSPQRTQWSRILKLLRSKPAYGPRLSFANSRLATLSARSFSLTSPSTKSSALRTVSRQQRGFHENVKHSYSRHKFRARQTSTLYPFRRKNSRHFSTKNSPDLRSSEQEPQTLSARLKKLSREYGWSALGVYFLLTALDFPFCFAAVRLLGVERIGQWEHVVIGAVKDVFRSVWPFGSPVEEGNGSNADIENSEQAEAYDHGVTEAQRRNESAEASIWTQLAFAYAIHKSFIFIRVPLTAAITPKVVKTLRGWGWNIGKRKSKVPKSS